jgi:hypothetical protein
MRAHSALVAILVTGCFVVSATSARAAIIASTTLIKDPSAGMPFGGPDAALPAPWVSYKLSVSFAPWDDIQAADVLIEGPLHQRWNDTNNDGAFEPTPQSVDLQSGDSHLLIPVGSLIGAIPTEDNPGAGSPLSSTSVSEYGVGSSLFASWAPPPPLSAIDIAYIVIPKGSEHNLSIHVSLAGEPPGYRLTTRDFFPVPEPASNWLAAIAAALIGVAPLRVVRRGPLPKFVETS